MVRMKDNNSKILSVLIPCRNEEKYLETCLDSILNTNYLKKDLEVFVIDGNSTDNTRAIAEQYEKKYDFIHLVINEQNTVPFAMNLGIKKSSANYIIRLDAHSRIPENYFSELIKWSEKLNADNVGAIWITDVKNKNIKSNSIIKVLSSRFGVGNSFFRIGVDQVKEVDTVPFGCYKKEVFEKIGLYDTRLTRNQDIELNKRLKRNNGKIFLLPDLFCKYFARETFAGLAKNNFGNGLWNILTVYITKQFSSISLRHFIPLLFLLSLIAPLLLTIWFPPVGFIAALSFAIYFFTLLLVSLRIKDKSSSFYLIMWTFIVLHLSYGFGSFIGLFRIDYLFKSGHVHKDDY